MSKCGTSPLIRKLGIKAAMRVVYVNAPATFARTLGPLPPDVMLHKVDDVGPAKLDLIVFFARTGQEVERRFAELAGLLAPAGGLWIAWPKKSSGVATDLTDDEVRRLGLDHGLVDNKVCSIDATWSAQRFVVRLKDRPKRAGARK